MSISRYTRPNMGAFWTESGKWHNVFAIWQAVLQTSGKTDPLLHAQAKQLKEWLNATPPHKVDAEAISRIEAQQTKHDVRAAQIWLRQQLGNPNLRVHEGLTSSDVLDTALSMQLVQSTMLLKENLANLLAVLKRRAEEFKYTRTIGRTHGIHAEPTTFGIELVGHYAEFKRGLRRLEFAQEEIAVCQLSGAVGMFAHQPPQLEEHVAAMLGLNPEPVSTQVIPRDRHAMYVSTLAVIAGGVERLAVNLRLRQLTEIGELREFFSEKQEGSSAMPHKRNPIGGENLTGQARIVRAQVIPALENIALWFGRDISHSAPERTSLPDAIIALDYALNRLATQVDKTVVYPERMAKNLASSPVASGQLRDKLVFKGMPPDQAYTLAKTLAHHSLDNGIPFADVIAQNEQVAKLISPQEQLKLLSLENHFAHVDAIFNRVLTA